MYSAPQSTSFLRLPRLIGWLIATIVIMLALAFFAPEQMPVIGYKLALVMLGAVLAYWIDRSLFPYARPHECLPNRNCPGGGATEPQEAFRYTVAFAAACLRRSLIVLACVLGLTLGL